MVRLTSPVRAQGGVWSCVLELRSHETVKLTKVEGHADDEMVWLGVVRALAKGGNDRADLLPIVVADVFRGLL